MFKDKFNSDIENLSPNTQLKAEFVEKLREETPKHTFNFKLTSAIAACLAVVLTFSFFIERFNKQEFYNFVSSTEISSNEKCNKILTEINELSDNYSGYFSQGYVSYYSSDGLTEDYDGSSVGIKGKPELSLGTPEYSETNKQVANVDEDDIIKTDGKYIYRLRHKYRIDIYKADGEETKLISTIGISPDKKKKEDFLEIKSFYLYNNHLEVISKVVRQYDFATCKCNSCQQENRKIFTRISIFNLEKISNPKLEKTFEQIGEYDSSRIIDNVLYLNSSYQVWLYSDVDKSETKRYLPLFYDDGKTTTQRDENIFICENINIPNYSVLCSYNLDTNKRIDDLSSFGDGQMTYVSQDNIYFTDEGDYSNTIITRVSVSKGKMKLEAQNKVKGYICDQFSMDEYNGYLRMVTTIDRLNTTNALYVLNMNLKVISSIENLAKGEEVESVRFLGDYGYFVTFKQVDPLFCANLTNPKHPKIVSKLKIPGFSEYLHPFGEDKLLGFGQDATLRGFVNGLKLSMFDISDPANVTEEFKTSIKDTYADYSNNHKSVVVSENKNLIAFATENEGMYEEETDDCACYYFDYHYLIYSYDEENGFTKKLEFEIGKIDDCDDEYCEFLSKIRGLYIGDYFYISTPEELHVIDLNTFKEVKTIS